MLGNLPEANVQYNDMKGTSALDWHDRLHFLDFVKSKGLDTERFKLIGFEVTILEGSVYCSIYAMDNETTPLNNNTIPEYLESHNGILPVKKFSFVSNLEEINKYMKRFSAVLYYSISGLRSFDEIDTIQLD